MSTNAELRPSQDPQRTEILMVVGETYPDAHCRALRFHMRRAPDDTLIGVDPMPDQSDGYWVEDSCSKATTMLYYLWPLGTAACFASSI